MNHYRSAGFDGLAAEAEKLRRWLFEAAFPLWWQVGADRSAGGCYEQIAFDGRPVILPKRSRVAARQIFCYHQAGRLGWQGPWRDAGHHALAFLRERFVRSDGTVVAAVGQDGSVVDPTFDLYNQAFALLAYACGHQTIDPSGGWRTRACALIETLSREFAHPEGGFREDRDGALTLRANPHMHLLEAALVWLSIERDPVWQRMADGIAALCLERFIDRETGALREHFGVDWAPLCGIQGQIVEPGHHYEWAFLLDRWAKLTGRGRPAAVGKLIAFADRNGIDPRRRVAVNAIGLDGCVHDPVARLWPQTERIRAYIIDRKNDGDARLHEAIATLWRYLDAPLSGLWYENLAADGRFVIEAAPATSLYHIVGAAAELWTTFAARAQTDAPVQD
jgi:mannose/cellobiose epimerase-like protein (N-acyl-D-glucosamine 2-epimerase family)